MPSRWFVWMRVRCSDDLQGGRVNDSCCFGVLTDSNCVMLPWKSGGMWRVHCDRCGERLHYDYNSLCEGQYAGTENFV
jgi:hypothetical protein